MKEKSLIAQESLQGFYGTTELEPGAKLHYAIEQTQKVCRILRMSKIIIGLHGEVIKLIFVC